MSLVFNPLVKKGFDETGNSQADNDARYVKKSGDTMTGDLNFPVLGYVMRDSNGVRWKVTIGTDGAIVTTPVATTPMGTPWLWMFGTI